jgi:GT2 family glycosyltransferase
VVVLAWDQLRYTMHFVESVRRHTDVPYELIVVDNGSHDVAARYAAQAGDRAVLHDANLGFARGMNAGLAEARGRFTAFCNNDTVLPPGWASALLETADRHPNAGIVVPAITASTNEVTVRSEPGTAVAVLRPFSAPPAAVVYLMRTDLVRALGGWSEAYDVASGEDVDLGFTVWVNDLDIVYDQRVLVEHVGSGTSVRLGDWRSLWAQNRRLFLERWQGDATVPRLASCDPERFARNRATAAAVAEWMARFFELRDRPLRAVDLLSPKVASRQAKRQVRALAGRAVHLARGRSTPRTVRRVRRGLQALPPPVERSLRRAVRRVS